MTTVKSWAGKEQTYLISKIKSVLKYVLAPFFVLAGLNHFRVPDFYTQMIPPYLRFPLFLIYLSGAFEVVLGAALLIPRCRRMAAWGLIALLVAVFPANIHMALNPEVFPDYSPAMLWVRLPLQLVFAVWAYWYTRADARKGVGGSRTSLSA
jgi:uncharacterized membrane protein